ncbi:AraC family transcriptional regulator [Siphonobacter sp. SORGH_AS_1065]|uniref:helix-turn-helix transcriptional regulator n=1 Tax=Siphonobacter sp. SORGH_AS_1065 TaxID=3041795 RepID=UPI002788D780|nr:AraC family transcriptional regulator [Siphonobacter sp. SORGH_AS_1065]MDQ1087105.1 AraC family transcriptional activator of pyochelin receptor [Siphonobacter sp. SORGH_AS_1065]
MKIVFSSDDIREHNFVKEYSEGFKAGSSTGIREVTTEFRYAGIHSQAQRFSIDGVIAGFFQSRHDFSFTHYIESDFPYLQMHFELTTQGCLYQPKGDFEPHTLITKGQHALLFYPALKGPLTYLKTPGGSSVEIELSLDFMRKLFNNDLEQLGTFGRRLEQAQPALLGQQSYPITPRMIQVLSEIRNCQYVGSLKRMFVEAKIVELLTLQIDQILSARDTQPILKKKTQDKLQEVRTLLLTHLDTPCSIETLSKTVGINRTNLQEGFKQLFGTTIFGYITDQRMERAQEFLASGRYETIAEVAALVGYKNPQHFTAAFKRKFGYLPKQLLKSD